jgi:hypothetical protein
VGSTWFFVNATVSPYQTVLVFSSTYAIDLRLGPVTMLMPLFPTDGLTVEMADWYNLSSVGSPGAGQPGGPIVLSTGGSGITIEDPSNPGTFATSVHIADPAGFAGIFRYSLIANAWKIGG